MANVEVLPDSLMIDILISGVLKEHDVLNFGAACHRFNGVCKTNSVWKHLCLGEWPSLVKRSSPVLVAQFTGFASGKSAITDNTADPQWLVVYKQIHFIYAALGKLVQNHIQDEHLDDNVYDAFHEFVVQYTYEFVATVLKEILITKCKKTADLTQKYYARKVYRMVRQKWLSNQIASLVGEEEGAMIVEDDQKPVLSNMMKGAILVERWFNILEDSPTSKVETFIREASEKTLQHYTSSFAKSCEVDDTTISHNKLKSLNYVLYEDLKFSGNSVDYFNVKNSYINHVIESRTGIPILLCIIYSEIAKRVGVKLECVNQPGHFVLRWKFKEIENPKPTTSDIAKAYRYIDAFNNGKIIEFNELHLNAFRVEPATISEVLHRVSLNVDAHTRISHKFDEDSSRLLDAINLCLILDPNSHRVRMKRIQLHYEMNFNLPIVLEDNRAIPDDFRPDLSLRPMKDMKIIFSEKVKKSEQRKKSYIPTISFRSSDENSNVTYSVGMVMRHLRYDYKCVIRGLDNTCKMSEGWKQQMGVYNLPNGCDQPYYHVLVHKDESQRYAAEENLEPFRQEDEIDHVEIGRYFSSTSARPTRCYHPNSALSLRYPEDAAATLERGKAPLVAE